MKRHAPLNLAAFWRNFLTSLFFAKLSFVLIILAAFFSVSGTEFRAYAGLSTTTAQFIKIPSGIRAASMGESFVALADDASAANWNPAGLAQLDQGEFQSMFLKYFADINYFFGGLVLPAGDLGTLATSMIYEWVPPFNSTADPNAIKGVASDLGITLAYGLWAHPRLAVGVAGHFYSSRLIDREAKGGGLDLGVLVPIIRHRIQFGFSFENVVSGMSTFRGLDFREKLPSTIRVGLLGRMPLGSKVASLLTLEYSKPSDSVNWFKAGMEFSYRKMLFLRAGYRLRTEGSPFSGKGHLKLGGLAGASFGAGIRLDPVAVHYAFVPLGDLGDTHRVGFSYFLGGAPRSDLDGRSVLEEAPLIPVDIQLDLETGIVKRAEFSMEGLTDTVREDINEWVLDITDPKGNVVRTFRGRGAPPSKIPWDGKDELGGTVTGGAYSSFRLRLQSREGREIVEEGILVDPEILARSQKRTLRESVEPTPVPKMKEEDIISDGPARRIPSIEFDSASTKLSLAYKQYLNRVADVIKANPGCRVLIEGHSSAEGSPQTNLGLSQDRANSVLRYLVEELRIKPASITARGHGSTAPKTSNRTEQGRRSNRRVEILVILPRTAVQ